MHYAWAGLLLMAAPMATAQEAAADDVILGTGDHRYRWVKNWPRMPEGMSFGNTHGCMVVDRNDRIYINTDSKQAVMVFEADGTYVEGWGEEFASGAHGLAISTEGNNQFLYLSHLGRHEVVKLTLEGDVLWSLGYPQESGAYQNAGQYKPTGVAVAPNGDLFVVDGYGLSLVHQYDWKGDYKRTFGGRGKEPGKMVTCHGVMIDHRGETPTVLVSDRENGRLQTFDLDGNFIALHEGNFRRPCSTYAYGETIVVADLAGRVTLLDKNNELIAHLGDNPDPAKRAKNGVPKEQWKDGEFTAPHSACFDSQGNLYVMDWNRWGRVTKLERLK